MVSYLYHTLLPWCYVILTSWFIQTPVTVLSYSTVLFTHNKPFLPAGKQSPADRWKWPADQRQQLTDQHQHWPHVSLFWRYLTAQLTVGAAALRAIWAAGWWPAVAETLNWLYGQSIQHITISIPVTQTIYLLISSAVLLIRGHHTAVFILAHISSPSIDNCLRHSRA